MIRKSLLGIFLIVSVSSCFYPTIYTSNNIEKTNNIEIDKLLNSAEGLFVSMKEKKYTTVWSHLSLKSKNAIVNETYNVIVDSGITDCSQKQINNDFKSGGPIAIAYWNSYLDKFDPDMVLEHSKWEMGLIKEGEAEIDITYTRAKRPVILKMYKELDIWKVGLVETFWKGARKIKFFKIK